MSRKNRRRKPMGEINVVPYIDVTLVLLIIFMITTPMLQTGVDVDLPQAESKEVVLKDDQPPVIVIINEQGQFAISTDNKEGEPVLAEEINARVKAVISDKPGTPVLIKADKNVAYGTVVTVMAALKNTGVPNVGLMTEPDEK